MPLLDYQHGHFKTLLRALMHNGAALDASDTGTGKTYVALEIARALQSVPLVIGPKSACGGWEEASEASGVPVEFVNWEKLRGARRGTAIAETEWLVERPWGKGSYLEWKQPLDFIVLDEIHRAGGETSLNSKAVIAAKRQHRFCLGLSATAADDPRQMKALGYMLGLHGLSKKAPVNYIGWLLRHGVTPGVFGGWDFGGDDEKKDHAFRKMNAAIFPLHGSRMRKTEIPGFPKTTIETKLFTDEDGEAKKIAAELHKYGASPDSLEEAIKCRQHLEKLKIPFFFDIATDAMLTSRVIHFVNFTDTRLQLVKALSKLGTVGQIFGGQKDDERKETIRKFQRNEIDNLVCNAQAGGESCNLHDPTGVVERTSLISPCESGRQLKQVLGRPNRAGGAFSRQLICFFKDTYEEKVADRVQTRIHNIDLLNDGDLIV